MPRTVTRDPITGVPIKNSQDAKVVTLTVVKDEAPVTQVARKVAAKKAPLTAERATADGRPVEPKASKGTAKKYAPPKNPALCADEFYRLREQRLALQKQVDAIEAMESACREHLINTLPKSEASGIAGKLCRVAVENKEIVRITDWDAFWGFIVAEYKKNKGVGGILQRRVNEKMVQELWANKRKVPGAEAMDVPVLRVNKL